MIDASDDSAVRTCKVLLTAFTSPNSILRNSRHCLASLALDCAYIEALP
jgi:hypothetical protein